MANEETSPSTAADPSVAEHARPDVPAAEQHGSSYTAWHPLLAQVLIRVLSSPALEVHPFVKLGTLPLEADIILLRKQEDVDLSALFPEFGFLLQFLKKYLLIEYKSPLDRLERADFDTARAYAMLCKRKYQLVEDGDIAVALLYSQLEESFFKTCAKNGYRFAEATPGIWRCEEHPLHVYAVDLGAFGARHPDHPINLFSKRFRSYRPIDERWQQLLGPIQRHVLGEMKAMQARLKGQEELNQTMEKWEEEYLAGIPEEKRLRGLSTEARLRGLPTEERLRGLPAEDLLRGLSADVRQKLRDLLEREPKSKS